MVFFQQTEPSLDFFPMEVEIALDQLPTGYYFLSLLSETGDLLLSEKIIKR